MSKAEEIGALLAAVPEAELKPAGNTSVRSMTDASGSVYIHIDDVLTWLQVDLELSESKADARGAELLKSQMRRLRPLRERKDP